jgi:hypothetical protein
VLPKRLVGAESQDRETGPQTRPAYAEAVPALAAGASAAPPHPASAPLPAEASSPVARHARGSGLRPAESEHYAMDTPPPASPVTASDGSRPPLPTREPVAQPGGEDLPRRGRRARTAPGADPAGHPGADNGERPQLPERRAQKHLAPQLRDAPAIRRDEPVADHTPGLMAAFQGGVSRAEKGDETVPVDRSDPTG